MTRKQYYTERKEAAKNLIKNSITAIAEEISFSNGTVCEVEEDLVTVRRIENSIDCPEFRSDRDRLVFWFPANEDADNLELCESSVDYYLHEELQKSLNEIFEETKKY